MIRHELGEFIIRFIEYLRVKENIYPTSFYQGIPQDVYEFEIVNIIKAFLDEETAS